MDINTCRFEIWIIKEKKIESKQYYSVGTVPKYNPKIIETDGKSIPRTHIKDRSLLWISTCTSIKM